jgi:D-erythro-7,8-dihydroneopterin triphosphate epimerase
MIIRIKNLRLRTVVGTNEWEREAPQDVIINVEMEFDGSTVARTDRLQDTIDYKTVKRRIIDVVEGSSFYLLDRLANRVLEIVMEEEKVQRATVEVDKPHALRFADSVSVSCSAQR